MDAVVEPERERAAEGWGVASASAWLFLLFCSFYLLIGRGTFFTGDEGGIFNTALAMLDRSLAVPRTDNTTQRGADGRYYSNQPILPSVLALPPVWIGVRMEHSDGWGEPPRAPGAAAVPRPDLATSNWPIFLTLLLGAASIAGTVGLVHRFALEDGALPRLAVALAAIAGLATPLAVYAKTYFPQVIESFLLMYCLLLASRWRRAPDVALGRRLGLACGLALLARVPFLAVIPLLGAFLALTGRVTPRTRRRALVGVAAPVAAALVITAAFNQLRYGDPLDFGHFRDGMGFTTDPVTGIAGLLISPGKGALIYAPCLLLVILLGRRLWRRGREEVLLLLAVTVVYLVLYGTWGVWQGGLCWGPRFLLPLMAPWVALLGRGLREDGAVGARRIAVAAAVVGASVQALGAALHPHWIYLEGDPPPFSLLSSHLPATVQALRMHGVDDLWLLSQPGRGYWIVLVPALAGLAAGLVGTANRLRRTSCPPPAQRPPA